MRSTIQAKKPSRQHSEASFLPVLHSRRSQSSFLTKPHIAPQHRRGRSPPLPFPSTPPFTAMSSTPAPPPPPNSMVTVSPPASVAPSLAPPPPPPNSEVHVRTRANSLSPRHGQGSLSKRTGRDFAAYLTKVQEEMPGSFYECHTGVPENTPKTSVASHSVDGCSSPRSDRTNLQPTTLNLPHIVERLQQLPRPAASRFSSPPSSVYGESSECHHSLPYRQL
jgi:hypothetical protein